MHIVLLVLGIALGLFGLYRFLLNASVKQVTTLFLTGGFIIVCAAIFFLAVTGRLPAAVGLVVALAPFALPFIQRKLRPKGQKQASSGEERADNTPPPPPSGPMTEKEAREILGVPKDAARPEIETAYKRLMKKLHPDQEGSSWMAQKLNEARDKLLK